MEGCTPCDTPITRLYLKAECPTKEVEKRKMESYPYIQVIGSVMFLQITTRPDLAFAVSHLSIAVLHESWHASLGGSKTSLAVPLSYSGYVSGV